ncbi:MAG TPA: LCP family protein [Iamia sp.]|nr:LCP family protein [Iamia sp.]
MTILVILFVIGLFTGVAAAVSLSLFAGKRVVRADGRPTRKRGPLRILMGLVGIGITLMLVAVEGGWVYANAQFDKIERVDVDVDGDSVLAGSQGGTNYLLVGTDNREGQSGNRSDTILVLRTGDGPARLLSIPRDLRVPLPSQGGNETRINAAYNDGPVALIRAVQESVGIPIDRYIEINFVSFAGLVDALGGVTINFPNPAIDTHSGLNVEQSGDVELQGDQALAYVRSRFYQEVIDGEVQPADGLADLSRIQRQQTFLRAVLSEAGSSRNPLHLARIGDALVGGLRIDNHMQLADALAFAWNMGRLDPVQTELPVSFIQGSGEVALAPEAQAVIQDFAT